VVCGALPGRVLYTTGAEQGHIGEEEEERRRNEGAGEETEGAARPLCVRQRELGRYCRGIWSKGGSELRVMAERGMLRGTDVMDISGAMARGNRHQQSILIPE
jgi:hypothetical protein